MVDGGSSPRLRTSDAGDVSEGSQSLVVESLFHGFLQKCGDTPIWSKCIVYQTIIIMYYIPNYHTYNYS